MGFVQLLEVASMPVIQVLLVSALGAFMATQYFNNLLSPDFRKSLNKVVFFIFTPSLIFSSFAKSVSLQDMISWWFMPVNVGLTFLIGGILGWILVKLLRPNLKVEGLIIAACSSGYNFKMSTYSEATLPFDVYSDTDEVEFNSVNDIDTDSDTDGVEFNSVNDVDTDSDTEDIKVNSNNDVRIDGDADGVEFNHGNGVCNEQGKENFDGYKCISDVTNDDIRDMEFNTEDEAIKFYVLFAKYHWFEVRKDDVKRDSNGNIIMRQLVCNKEGVNDGKNKKNGSRSTLTIRTNCSAKLRVVYDFVRTIWRVSVFKPSHNHELAPLRFVHLMPNYSKLSEVDKQVASGLHSQGVRTCHILGFLMGQKGGHEGLGFIKKDLYNFTDHQARVKMQDGDTFATLSYFQGKADTDTSFFSEFTFTDDGRLENIFWADSTSRFDYECFGDVVAFDTTYRKNKYGKPLVIFSGYNHHGETTIFACALICDETIETYKWVLNLFSKAMYDKHPKAVITDGNKSMRKAIRVVFPNTRHHLCAWHLHRNVVQHVKNSKFLEEFKSLMYSPCTPEKFESEWKRVVENFDLSNNRWVKKIYRLKRMWASAYMRDHFLCGVKTTSICEGVNSFIKKYVRHKNSLVDFLHNFERALKEYRHNELLFDFKSFYYHPMLTTALTTFESEASKIFTGKKFKDVKKAIEDVVALSVIERDEDEDGNIVIFKVNVFGKKDVAFSVYLDKLQTKFLCDCRRFERRGLPCSHIICAMKYDNMDVFPESLICKRWTKTAKNDHISSFASQEGNDEKMTIFRRGALAAAFNSLCNVSCKSASDYKEALEGIYSLCNKINSRHEGNGHDKDKGSKFVASDKANKFVANDPLMVNVKGARRSKKSTPRTRCCSNCRNPGHTIRTCPELAGIGVVSEDQGEKASPIESDNESKSLSLSMSNDINDDIHSVAVSNGGRDVEKSTGITRKRECDNVAFSTQDSVNKRKTKTNTSTRKGDACVTPNITINIDNNGVTRDFGHEKSTLKQDSHCASWNHNVGYGVNYFNMHYGLPNNGGSVFPQFPPTTTLSSHSNTALHTGTHNVSSYTPFMSALKNVELLAKHRSDYCGPKH